MTSWIQVTEHAPIEVGERPAYLLRREFGLDKVPGSALLRISAHGIYTAYINGHRVGNDELTPGYTDYNFRTQFQTYDVTELLEIGQNALVVELADGWYRGGVGLLQGGDQYGERVELWAEILADGVERPIVETDSAWRYGPSHILKADLFRGQVEDLRLKDSAAYLSGFDDLGWCSPKEVSYGGELFAQTVESSRVIEYLKPKSVRRIGPSSHVVDFGRNSNGWVRLGNLGAAGNSVTITCGEWTDANGDVTMSNLDVDFPIFPHPVWAHQVDTVISDGNPASVFEPRFTTHGFQFARIEGIEADLNPADVAAAVVHTDLNRIGRFRSSDDRVNWLHDAALWSFRGNACEVPTDCPTRERSGWTGDWQIYVETASFLYDVREFNRKFLADVRLIQEPSGKVLNIAPKERSSTQGIPGNSNGSAGWGDVVVQAPWMIYREYGETDQLEENFAAMVKWIEFGAHMAATARHESRQGKPKGQYEDFLWDTGHHWGEWFEPGNIEVDFEAFLKMDKGLVATSYLYRSSRDAAAIGRLLEKPADQLARLDELATNARLAWQEAYLLADGKLSVPSQANYARSLAFGLFPEELVSAAAAELARLVTENGYRLSTGFLTTALLLPVLTDHGYADLAYRLLFQEQEPSWLAMRNRGATTIWEQWDGVREDGSLHDSLNHYSKGAVIDFLHQYVAGLKLLEPGYRSFSVKPVLGGGLTWARTSHKSPMGLICVDWNIDVGDFNLEVEVPAGAVAHVTLPNGEFTQLGEGVHSLVCKL